VASEFGLEQQGSHGCLICNTASTKDKTPSSVHLDLSSDLIEANKAALMNEEWFISFPSSWLSDHRPTPTLVIPTGESLTTVDVLTAEEQLRVHSSLKSAPSKRKLRETYPQESVLIILISAQNVDLDVTPSDAMKIVFGAGAAPGEVSAASQFSACSFGELELVPFSDTPAISVKVDNNVNQYDKDSMSLEARKKACVHFGLPASCWLPSEMGVDHIMFLVPFGLSDDTGASAGFAKAVPGGTYSIYQGPKFAPEVIMVGCFCTLEENLRFLGLLCRSDNFFSCWQHEFGHNFYLGHAGESSGQGYSEYGDSTGVMGKDYVLGSVNGNKRCFNGWNMWEMGWLKDRR